MSDTVDDLITRIIQREKGYVNHPADRGGPTKYGITIDTLRWWRRTPVSAADVEALTEEEARRIYRTNYFTAGGFEAIKDPSLREFMFDFAVNSGVSTASKALQTALDGDIAIDGVIGPQTMGALAKNNNPEALFYKVKCERYELLLRFIGRDAEQAAFATGWANRLDEFWDVVDKQGEAK